MALKRILKEKNSYFNEGYQIEGVNVQFDENDLFLMHFTIDGPKGTPYYGGVFKYKVQFPKDYPFKPMKTTLLQKIYHISNYSCILSGCNCCAPSYLKLGCDSYSPALTFWKTIEGIKKCFYPDIFLDCEDVHTEAKTLYKNNKKEFTYQVQLMIASERAREFVLPFLVFQNNIKDYLSINSDSVFIDLHF